MTVTISCSPPGMMVSITALPPAVSLYLTVMSPSMPLAPLTSLPTHSPSSCLNLSKVAAFFSSPRSGSAITARNARHDSETRMLLEDIPDQHIWRFGYRDRPFAVSCKRQVADFAVEFAGRLHNFAGLHVPNPDFAFAAAPGSFLAVERENQA